MAARQDIREINIGEDRFRYLDPGQGEPVLFVHGALGDLRTFAPHCEILSRRCRALTYTQRHFGPDPWPVGGPAFGISTHVDDLVALVEGLGLAPVAVVAWSYAGHAALRAAQLRPDLFSRMLIYETGFQTFMTDKDDITAFRSDIEAMFQPIFAAARANDLVLATRLLIESSGDGPGYFDRQSPERQRIELDNAHTMALLLAQTPPPKISADDMQALAVPVTIACGETTRPAYRLVSKAAMALLPGRKHIVVPGVGHLWPDEDPAGFARLVADWLDAA